MTYEEMQCLEDETSALIQDLAVGLERDADKCMAIAIAQGSRRLPLYGYVFLTEYGIEKFTCPSEKKTKKELEFWHTLNLRLKLFNEIRHNDGRDSTFNRLCSSMHTLNGLMEEFRFLLISEESCGEDYIVEMTPLNARYIPGVREYAQQHPEGVHFFSLEK